MDRSAEDAPPQPAAAEGGAEQRTEVAQMDAEALEARRNRGRGQYGCSHYRRRVKFITPCCDEEWWCRHCHNKAKDTEEQDWQRKHELDRKAITELVCALCNTRQPVGTCCTACGVSFGAYSCLTCRFFDDDLSKQPYHCDQCGICRIGGRSSYFHCDTCGSCYAMALKGNHQCVERAMHQNCPICFEFLFESVDPTTVLRCGHTIHTQCVRELEASHAAVCPSCPICKKSLGDYSAHWRDIDSRVAVLPVPPEYRGWRADILCNDCSHSSSIAFHLLGLKCGACGSYNTRRMGLHTSDGSPMLNAGRLGRPDAAPGPAVAAAAAAAAGVAVGGALVPDLLQALFGPPPPGHAGDEEEEEEEEEDEEEEEEGDEEEWEEADEWLTDDGEGGEEEEEEEAEEEAGEEEEQAGQQQGIGLNMAPAAAAAGSEASAGAAGELALAVLAPGLPQLAIFGHLEQDDKLRLSATCTGLRQASLAWFPEVTVVVKPGKIDAASLAAWLERHQAQLNLLWPDQASSRGASKWERTTISALPAHLVSSLSSAGGFPAAGSALSALTRLSFNWLCGDSDSPPAADLLKPMSRLRQLSMIEVNLSSTAKALLALPALKDLQALALPGCRLRAVPPALSILTRLTSLDLSDNRILGFAPLASLQRLQSLDLRSCCLTSVPQQLSALAALTRLSLSENSLLGGGWQHLLPLVQLQHLDLWRCELTAVPRQLSALTALTTVDITHTNIENGWQHLMPLVQLCQLDLWCCSLTAVPEQLSTMTALTLLDLYGNQQLTGGWQHLLPRLQDLKVSYCGITAVPEQLSKLTALTLLDLADNDKLTGGWQHLMPQLLDLNLSECRLKAVPEQLSALTALTRLNLSGNDKLAGGWQHLLPLIRLRSLALRNVRLPSSSARTMLAALPHLHIDYY
ncbi:E3 ubiquitin-protein ligase [Chlorella vulgaris]